MTIKSNFPEIRPSLNLDFANTRALDPRITFTRTTTATYYDGKTTAKAEENLLLYSQAVDNAIWNATPFVGTITADNETAPDGTTTADTLEDNATNSSHRLLYASSSTQIPGSTTFTLSVFLKKGTHDYAYIGFRDGSTTNRYIAAAFDLDLGTAGDTFNPGGGTLVGSTITSVGNGWYRCSVTGALSGTTNSTPNVIIGMTTAATGISLGGFLANSYIGTGTTLYVWGAQLEQRSAVSSYTPTTTQPITNYIPVLQTAASGVARFDHNPTTGESLGLLVEEQRTNLMLRSEDFSTSWTNSNSTEDTNVIVSPAGTLTGDKIVEDTSSNVHNVFQNLTTVIGTSYAFSVYAKRAGRDLQMLFGFNDVTDNPYANFDLSTGVVSQTNGTITAAIQNVGNGWYRCSVVVTSAVTTNFTCALGLINSTTATRDPSYTGDGYSGIYIWGAQLEAGAFPTSYIATTSASVTRNADAASMTGTNFSSWYRADEGSVYCEFQTALPSSILGVWSINNSGSTNKWDLRSQAGLMRVTAATNANSDGFNQLASSFSANTFYKVASGLSLNSLSSSLDGASTVNDTSVSIPVGLNQLQLGNLDGGTSYPLRGTIRKLAFYPFRLTNEQLQALTAS
jgi:hypothetical protein